MDGYVKSCLAALFKKNKWKSRHNIYFSSSSSSLYPFTFLNSNQNTDDYTHSFPMNTHVVGWAAPAFIIIVISIMIFISGTTSVTVNAVDVAGNLAVPCVFAITVIASTDYISPTSGS